MERVSLGGTDLKVSRLCMGTMTFGAPSWRPWVLDEAASAPILRAALDRGINFFDMADFYSLGIGEEVVGRTLLRNAPRDQLVLASKVYYPMGPEPASGGLSRKHILEAIDGSLRRIGTDYLDLYIVHAFDPETCIEETLEALADVVQTGKARWVGASTMYAWQFAKMLYTATWHGWPRFVSMQCQLNAAYREEEREMIPFCIDEGIAVTPFSPLARGLLSGDATSRRVTTDNFAHDQYGDETSQQIAGAVSRLAAVRGCLSSQVALAWVMARPGVTSTLIGVDSVQQLDDAIAATEMRLSDDELYEVDRHYTPCDVINDHHPNRTPREPRPARIRVTTNTAQSAAAEEP